MTGRIMRAESVGITVAIVHITRIDAHGIRTSTVEDITDLAGALDGMRHAFV